MWQRKQLQLWVHYRQALGAWGWRINTGGVVVWSSSMADYRTEYEAIDAARDAWERYSTEPAPQSTIYRTDMEYARASWQQSPPLTSSPATTWPSHDGRSFGSL